MEQSQFIEFLEKFFQKIVGKVTEKINDKKKETVLLHKTMLVEEYSSDLSWGASSINQSVVAADVVSTNSSLPLKRRGKINSASGKLPKIGAKFRLDEDDIDTINTMKAKGVKENLIASKIFADVPRAIKGVDVRTEIMFLQGLSTGYALVPDDETEGTAIRAKYGYKEENILHAETPWSQSTANPQDDVQRIFDKATEDANSVGCLVMDLATFNRFRKSTQGKILAANYRDQVFTDPSNLGLPSKKLFMEVLNDEFEVEIIIVNSAFRLENPDGSFTTVRPWETGVIVALPDKVCGRLVYGTLAEETNPVASVKYQKSGSHILISKYSKNDPLEEFTAGQSRCLPVIDGADGIYLLHTESTTGLSADLTSLSFGKEADAVGQQITVHSDNGFTASKGSASWLTINNKKGVVTVTVQANSGGERTANITLTDKKDSSITVVIPVTQEAGN